MRLMFPPMENGWHGGPPASKSTSSVMDDQSNVRTSPSYNGQSATRGKLFFWFSRIVSHAHLSHSTTASGLKPARLTPIASPPAPAYSSTAFINYLSDFLKRYSIQLRISLKHVLGFSAIGHWQYHLSGTPRKLDAPPAFIVAQILSSLQEAVFKFRSI